MTEQNGIDRECENISCSRDAAIKVAFGEDDPFYRVFCEPHARHERGKHDDAWYVSDSDGGGEP